MPVADLVTVPAAQPQLLLDDHLLETARCRNTVRTWATMTKHPGNPLMTPAGDETMLIPTGNVMRGVDPLSGRPCLQMWYLSFGRDDPAKPRWLADERGVGSWVSYATSDDGLAWTRPRVGAYEINGSTDNNAVYRPPGWFIRHLTGPILDPRPDCPEHQRYKLGMMCNHQRLRGDKHYVFAASADGLTWEAGAVYRDLDLGNPDYDTLVYDPYRQRYAFYCREGGEGFRRVALFHSDNFRRWRTHGLVMDARSVPAWAADGEIYGVSVFAVGGQWLALPMIYRDQINRLGVAHSRDGENWTIEDHIILDVSEPGGWDASTTYAGNALVDMGDEHGFYYGGRNSHHSDRSAGRPRGSGLGLATIGKDRWCSLGPADRAEPAVVQTIPLALPAGLLSVNAHTRAGGGVSVELLDPDGRALASAPDARQGLDLTSEQTASLRFELRDSELFAWRVEP